MYGVKKLLVLSRLDRQRLIPKCGLIPVCVPHTGWSSAASLSITQTSHHSHSYVIQDLKKLTCITSVFKSIAQGVSNGDELKDFADECPLFGLWILITNGWCSSTICSKSSSSIWSELGSKLFTKSWLASKWISLSSFELIAFLARRSFWRTAS